MSETIEQIITDEQLNKAWGNANFGSIQRREVLRNTLLKCASGYLTGHTAKCIAEELGLVHRSKWQLSNLGKRYLFAAYPEDLSAPAYPVKSQMFLGDKMRADIRKDMDDHSARWKALGWPPMSWEEGAEWMYWRAVMQVNKEPDLLEVDDENSCSPVDTEDVLKPDYMPETENTQASYWFEKARQNLVDRNDFKAQLSRANDKIKELIESKPSPVIEIGEQKMVSKEEFKEWLNKRDYGGPSAGMYRKGGWDAYEYLTEPKGSHHNKNQKNA